MTHRTFSLPRIVLGVAALVFVTGAGARALVMERELAGIALLNPVNAVLDKYGNPHRITLGARSGAGAQSPSGGSTLPPGVTVPGGGVRPMPMKEVSPFAGLGPGALPGLLSVGGAPGTSGQEYSGPTGSAGESQSGQGAGSESADTDVRYTYYLPKGPTLEFIISDGIVSQITLSGQMGSGLGLATLTPAARKAISELETRRRLSEPSEALSLKLQKSFQRIFVSKSSWSGSPAQTKAARLAVFAQIDAHWAQDMGLFVLQNTLRIWGYPYHTALGITLGESYKKVLLLYGYPDTHQNAGRFIRVGYLQRSNIMFTVRDNKTIVGITIGLKE